MSHDSEHAKIRRLVKFQHLRHRHLSSVHDADDLFQDAWLDLQHSGNDVGEEPEDRTPREQLLRRAVGRATDRAFGKLRKRLSRGSASETLLEYEPADAIPDLELVVDLRNQIDALPAEERTVIALLRRGYDGAEIAGMLSVSPQTVSRRKHQAIEKLRKTLGPFT